MLLTPSAVWFQHMAHPWTVMLQVRLSVESITTPSTSQLFRKTTMPESNCGSMAKGPSIFPDTGVEMIWVPCVNTPMYSGS